MPRNRAVNPAASVELRRGGTSRVIDEPALGVLMLNAAMLRRFHNIDSLRDRGASARQQSAALRAHFVTVGRYVQMARLNSDAALERSARLRRESEALDEFLNKLLKAS